MDNDVFSYLHHLSYCKSHSPNCHERYIASGYPVFFLRESERERESEKAIISFRKSITHVEGIYSKSCPRYVFPVALLMPVYVTVGQITKSTTHS